MADRVKPRRLEVHRLRHVAPAPSSTSTTASISSSALTSSCDEVVGREAELAIHEYVVAMLGQDFLAAADPRAHGVDLRRPIARLDRARLRVIALAGRFHHTQAHRPRARLALTHPPPSALALARPPALAHTHSAFA